ncbi:MAG: hypothetical protein ABH876_01260 [Patescibacteria group bacterium]|nr:hypothetical protein [Patescibacteria group bacterium]MBU1877285.1 hypothetical protein [Patescibacteria group bacterium]
MPESKIKCPECEERKEISETLTNLPDGTIEILLLKCGHNINPYFP